MRNIRRIALVGTLLLAAPWVATAQEKAPTHPPGHPPGHAMHKPGEHAAQGEHSCADMMEKHKEMQARMQAADAELDRLVAAMQAAKGEAKVEAAAAAVAALVEQRKAMHAMMMEHQPMMMAHMTGHGEGMAACPMMKKMHGAQPEPKPGAQQ